jgi:hypothetical protein
VAVSGALLWVVWRSPQRSDLSTFGAFAVAVIVPLVSLVIYLTNVRQAGETVRGRPLDEVTDSLAVVVTEQWTRAALERRLLQPGPIPVLWERSVKPLAGPVSAAVESRQFPPLPGLSPTVRRQLRGGRLQDLHAVYGGLGSGRLVIIGEPGSGKTGAAVLLVLAALKHRQQVPPHDRQLVPVPVMFTLHGWDPSTQRVADWLAAQLQATYPLFAGKAGRAIAAGLVNAGRVAVFLDGLDEIAEDLQPVALQALSQQTAIRLVVLARSFEMMAAARQGFLEGAAALELRAVDATAAADYLTRVQLDPPPRGWTELTGRLRREPGSSIAKALSNPLTLTLIRDTYRSGDDIRGLLDFCDVIGDVSGEDIQDHLLDRVLPAAYAPAPGEAAHYELDVARRTLSCIAARMSQEGTRDLSWWGVPAWASAVPRVIVTGAVFGLMFGLGSRNPVFGLAGGAVFAYFYLLGDRRKAPARRAPLRWRHLLSRSSLLPGLGYALTGGAVCTVFGLAIRLGAGQTAALAAGVGIGAGLAGVLAAGLSRSAADDASPLGPRVSWQRDQAFGLAVGLMLGLGLSLGVGLGIGLTYAFALESAPAPGQVAGLVLALVWLLVFGLVFGLVFPRTWTVSLTFAQLALRWRTPVRLLRFLDDARQRDVLRTIGPVYQFRHARLQDRLALANDRKGPEDPPSFSPDGAQDGLASELVRGWHRGRSVGNEFVHIAIGPAEVLPGRPRLAQQLDAGLSQFLDGRWQVTHGEPSDRTGTEMLLPGIAVAKYLDVASIRELEDPEVRFGVHQPEPENVLVEIRQFRRAIGARAAPAKPCDLHICQYQHHLPVSAPSIRDSICPAIRRPQQASRRGRPRRLARGTWWPPAVYSSEYRLEQGVSSTTRTR